MGSWFTSLHIRQAAGVTVQRVGDCVKEITARWCYKPVEDAQEADAMLAVVTAQDCPWISVYSLLFAHDDPDSCEAVAGPLSEQLHTDVLGISCFDSDYLYLNLINKETGTNAWVGIGAGSAVGIKRRNGLTAWKKKVCDYPAFSGAAKEQYICADEFLSAVEQCLELSVNQSTGTVEHLDELGPDKEVWYLYFQREEPSYDGGPHLELWHSRFTDACFADIENNIMILNAGEASRGLSVYFLGPYVEHEEIVFSDVRIGHFRNDEIPMNPVRRQLPDGQWAYYCHLPDLEIPERVPDRMIPEKRSRLEMERKLVLRFVPHGNPRKMLDITVMVVPDGNPENRVLWNIWEPYGSKAAFIKKHNRVWKWVRSEEPDLNSCLPLLKPEDFED